MPWGKIADARATNSEDVAIVEGYAALVPRVEGGQRPLRH